MSSFVIKNNWLVDGEISVGRVAEVAKLAFCPGHGIVLQALDVVDNGGSVVELIEALEMSGIQLRWRDLLGDLHVTSEEVGDVKVYRPKLQSLTRNAQGYLLLTVRPVVMEIYNSLISQEGFLLWQNAISHFFTV